MAHIGKKTVDVPRYLPGLVADRMVAEVAVGMANELYEIFMRENAVYKAMRAGGEISEKDARLVFVQRTAPKLYEDARLSLTDCLSLSDDVMPRKQKDEIAEALMRDTHLRANRVVDSGRATVPGWVH